MSTKSNDTSLKFLLEQVENGKAQLPEFQRNWVWDNIKICKLIESLTSGFPMGAIMFLDYGGDDVRFKYRPFTGVKENKKNVVPDVLVLDGQQRLTTLFQVLKNEKAVETRIETNKDKIIKRFYYLDIRKSLDENYDCLDSIFSIPENKKLTENIGRNVIIDLTTREKEFENLMFPLNLTFSKEVDKWMFDMIGYYKESGMEYLNLFQEFKTKVLSQITDYNIPVISLTKDTSKEAVCQIFENVNTGGVPLTVFELVTAIFAADEFDLRKDWEDILNEFQKSKTNLLAEINATNFMTSMALLASYKKYLNHQGTVSCKKKNVLKLDLSDYRSNRDTLVKGFKAASDFLVHEGIYTSRDLPYTSQLVPLAAIFAYDNANGNKLSIKTNRDKLSNWYWCGVFGELYGGANETRFSTDIIGLFDWINHNIIPDTVSRSNFQVTRLLTMQTRNSAAYKGMMALIMQDSPLDFMSANKMDIASFLDESTDIHHIFPQNYCEINRLPSQKWNSVVNKTPIYASTNRSIGGRAPSEYINTMKNKNLTDQQIDEALNSHMINPDLLRTDTFDQFIIDRAIKLLNRIELATGKNISGRDSEEVITSFGASLI